MVRAGTRAFSSLQLDARGVDRLCAAHRHNQSDAGHQLAAVASVHDGTGLGDLHTAFVARRLAAASASALLRSANTPQKEKRKGKKPPPRGGGRGSKGASRVSSAERAAPSAPHAAPAGTVPSPPTAHASLEESGLDPVLADLARTFLDDEREDALRRMLSEWDVEEHAASLRAFGVSSTQHLLDLQEADMAELGLTRDRARDLYAKIKAGQQRAAKEIAVASCTPRQGDEDSCTQLYPKQKTLSNFVFAQPGSVNVCNEHYHRAVGGRARGKRRHSEEPWRFASRRAVVRSISRPSIAGRSRDP